MYRSMLLHATPREILTWIGARAGARLVYAAQAASNYLYVGHWMRARGFDRVPRFWGPAPLFDFVAGRLAGQKVAYLELGVREGDSIRGWARRLSDPDSVLHGFDSFEGLPEAYTPLMPKGALSVGGALPACDDPRVSFHKGWFHETLPSFAVPERERLVIHLDADLYSSTKLALDHLRGAMRAGTILIFGQFHQREHELRAFEEFAAETGFPFRAIAATRGLDHVVFEWVDGGSKPAAGGRAASRRRAKSCAG